MQFGNDTVMTYSYEAERRRLDALTATNSNRTFQDNSYQYDAMSNILSVSNAASVPLDSNLFGGETSQSFAYDNLHQLISASGDWTSRQGHQERYSLSMSYDSIHNITAKNQLHERLPLDGTGWNALQGTSYDWQYDYAALRSHTRPAILVIVPSAMTPTVTKQAGQTMTMAHAVTSFGMKRTVFAPFRITATPAPISMMPVVSGSSNPPVRVKRATSTPTWWYVTVR